MSKTSLKTTAEWKHINWRKLERRVYKLQKRIYRASIRGDVKAVRKLQKTLMKSWSARATSVRRVTQDNKGKQTAGVDGVKALTPLQRLDLVNKLHLSSKVSPTRRVWIDKPGKEEKRPLGIPTMKDRAEQALVKQALEPEWEARFEPNSYGFRPGRSCHDGIEAIFNAIRYKPKYVLDADIAKCFDRINHGKLLEKLNTFPTVRRLIKAWLKAGVIDSKQWFPTSEGTPQGGVISPLLANIALHGMENRIKQAFPQMTKTGKETWFHKKGTLFNSPQLIRYADDFVILHENITVVQRCKEIISDWLSDMGLELKPSKTRIAHTLTEYESQESGFDFLGFNIRQFKVGKYQSKQGFKTIITPSKKKQKAHLESISKVVKAHKAAPQRAVISRLNPLIRGWANYYSTVVSKEVYSTLDHLMYQKLRTWSNRRHSNKNVQYAVHKYWKSVGGNNWEFATETGGNLIRLLRHSETPIVRHVKVKGSSSPYDGQLKYWSSRMGKNPEMPNRVAKLLKQQKGKCAHCELFFRESDVMEVDHIIPKSIGGRDEYKNLQLLHRHCHDQKTARDGSIGAQEKTGEWLDANPF